jgi:hypothetical protein
MVLSRDDILKADDMEKKLVSVPEWGGEVYVRSISGRERDGFDAQSTQGKGKDTKVNLRNFRARLCALTISDESGASIFSEGDVAMLGTKSAAALDRVFEVAAKLNRITKEDVEELTKNSESAPNDDSGSSSPES